MLKNVLDVEGRIPFEAMATLWPDMPHYGHFAKHPLLHAIRLNTAMIEMDKLRADLEKAVAFPTPVYLDLKGKQLRITKVDPCGGDHLELELNHAIEVATPTPVIFKSGADGALLVRVEGNRLVFRGGPRYNLVPGESVNIRSETLKVLDAVFTEQQLEIIEIAKSVGIERYMLSFVTSIAEINEFRSLVGDKAEIVAKIESVAGLKYVEDKFVRSDVDNVHLLTARGDLFVEVEKPHEILQATKQIIRADSGAILGSRILLSVTNEPVPSCSDLNELAWLLGIGYRRFMFCDGLCLKADALERAIRILYAVAKEML